MFGDDHICLCLLSEIMAPKNRKAAIEAFRGKLVDDSSDSEQPEELGLQTREASQAGQKPLPVDSTSLSDEEGSENGSERNSPQMTTTHMKSSSKEDSQSRKLEQSSSILAPPDP